MKIKELKEYINNPSKSIIDVMRLRMHFFNLRGTSNKRQLERSTAKAKRIEKLGEKRFGKDWWKGGLQ